MDVQADEARLRPDPSATAMVERPVTDSQGQLFGDAYPTYADTDKIPAVRPAARFAPARPGGSGSSSSSWRWSSSPPGATLGLVKAGVIDKSGTGSPKATTRHRSTTPPRHLEGAAGDPGLDRGRHGHLPGRHRRLRRDGDHVDRPLLGEHRRGGKAPEPSRAS